MDSGLSSRDTFVGTAALASGFAIGIFTNLFLKTLRKMRGELLVSDDEYDDVSDDDGENQEDGEYASLPVPGSLSEPHKLVLCVRTDLKMQKGKITAQAGHATLGAYQACRKRRPDSLTVWQNNAQPKIALQIPSYQQALDLQKRAKALGLSTFLVFDAGRTQVASVRFLTFCFLLLAPFLLFCF